MAEEGELDYQVFDGINARFKNLLTQKVRIKQNRLNILRAFQGSFIHFKLFYAFRGVKLRANLRSFK